MSSSVDGIIIALINHFLGAIPLSKEPNPFVATSEESVPISFPVGWCLHSENRNNLVTLLRNVLHGRTLCGHYHAYDHVFNVFVIEYKDVQLASTNPQLHASGEAFHQYS